MAKPKSQGITWQLLASGKLTEEQLAALGPPHVPTGPKIVNPEALEQAIYEDQELVIKAKYGKEAAQNANYGWAVEVEEDIIGVATKVYVDPCMILESEAGADGIIRHEWTNY